jgi:glycyl-tRNA synthetase beta chain
MQQASKNKQDFLIEIHTEELPPKALCRLAENFLNEIKMRLDKTKLHYTSAQFFATPRRLAVLIKKLTDKQPDTFAERKGPALEAAFDADGNPTQACVGFARSCGVTPAQLTTIKTPQGAWVGYQQAVTGKAVQEILPELIQQALQALPIPKRMRWGNNAIEFVRPVHSVIMLYGNEIIDAEILGCRTNRVTGGHRFLSKGLVSIANPTSYASSLKRKRVIADFAERRAQIYAEAQRILPEQLAARVVIEENLLDEVTGLVEWPTAICGSFDKAFLTVPAEALIAAMQDHQRYFPVVDAQDKLLPYFVAIANIESRDVSRLIAGNERVLRARLSDAAFFFAMDKKTRLNDRVPNLVEIIFQTKLGTLYDKAIRIATLAGKIAEKMHINVEEANRAGLLAKTDLTTAMVSEFPELQGRMGYYYALHDGEKATIAEAIHEHYMPRFSGDRLPSASLGCAVALADRIDTLVGIFGINQAPTGDKDPFALRRAALGVLRIVIEKKFNIDLQELIQIAVAGYAEKIENRDTVQHVLTFILERLKPWYQDQGISADVLASVAALNLFNLYDIHLRIQAVQKFKSLPEAESLSIANKRVSNILAKSADEKMSAQQIDEKLFENEAERALVTQLTKKQSAVNKYSEYANYTEILAELADLRDPLDNFFDGVMVMSEDKTRRENRLLMLKQLRELFLHVADIALLQ